MSRLDVDATVAGEGGPDLGAEAIVFERRARSHRALHERAGRVAAGLAGLGVAAGEPVALLSANRLEYLEIEAGIARAGAEAVHLDWRLAPLPLAALLARCEARTAFVDGPLLPVLWRLRRDGSAPALRTIVALGSGSGDLGYDELCAAGARAATAGLGAAHAASPGGELRFGAGCSTYVAADLAEVGRGVVRGVLEAGGTVHVRRSAPFSARPVVDYVVERGITHVVLAEAALRAVQRAGLLDACAAARVEAVVCEGGSGAAALVEEVRAALGGATVVHAPQVDCRFGQFPA